MKKSKKQPTEKDSVYFLKLVLFFILGTLWVRLGGENGVPIPVGLLFGVILASHEHFAVDRKIEYAVLLIATILSFIAPIGFVLTV
jgi:hypothetical protein